MSTKICKISGRLIFCYSNFSAVTFVSIHPIIIGLDMLLLLYAIIPCLEPFILYFVPIQFLAPPFMHPFLVSSNQIGIPIVELHS